LSKAKRSLSQGLTAAMACKSFLDSESIDSEIDELVVYRLREEVVDLVKGIRISLEILSKSGDPPQ